MITGIIALIILVAVLPPAIGDGNWLALAVGVVIALLLLAIGAASRESDRAYINATEYWANGGPNGKKRRRKPRKKAQVEEENYAQHVMDDMRREQARNGINTIRCFKCGGSMVETSRDRFDSGAVFVHYQCVDCKEKKLLKL